MGPGRSRSARAFLTFVQEILLKAVLRLEAYLAHANRPGSLPEIMILAKARLQEATYILLRTHSPCDEKLAPEEQRVGTLLEQGMTIAQVAEQLGKKPAAVRATRERLYRRLQVNKRAPLAFKMLFLGEVATQFFPDDCDLTHGEESPKPKLLS